MTVGDLIAALLKFPDGYIVKVCDMDCEHLPIDALGVDDADSEYCVVIYPVDPIDEDECEADQCG